MKAHWAVTAIFPILIGLASCMSSGTNVSDDQIGKFVKGKTTETEVIAALGQPDSIRRMSDGEHTDNYQYMKASASAQSFIPLIGVLVSSTDTKTKFVSFKFSKANILLDWESSSSASTIGTGPLSQH